MKVVTYSSIKGGVGKSSIAAMTANCLAASGKKVLVIDMDVNNSMSFYYLDKKGAEQAKEKNIYDSSICSVCKSKKVHSRRVEGIDFGVGTAKEKNIARALGANVESLNDYTIKTRFENIDIIASSLELIDLRAVSERRLKNVMPTLKGYDAVIIDTAPTYDNIVLNAYNASDIIITPILLTQFDYNTAEFLKKKLQSETDKYQNWWLVFNGVRGDVVNGGSNKQREYIQLFESSFANIVPRSAWIPRRETIKDIIDRDAKIRKSNALYEPVCNLAECFLDDEEELNRPEVF